MRAKARRRPGPGFAFLFVAPVTTTLLLPVAHCPRLPPPHPAMASIGGSLHRYADAVVTVEALSALAAYTETWFKSVLVCLAAAWLTWRIYRVTVKPVDELVSLLGLEVPAPPSISLAGIKADGVTLHWKPPDHTTSVTKYQLHINGISIGELSPKDTAANIHHLKPDHSYTIRVIALNANFQSASNPIRFTTLSASSHDLFDCADGAGGADEDDDDDRPPAVKPCKTLFEPNTQTAAPTPMAREHSSSISQKQRSPQARRISPILSNTDAIVSHQQDSADIKGNVKELTDELERIRKDLEDAENQERVDAEDYEKQKTELNDNRERHRELLHEKDTASRELRKEVRELERLNTSKNQQKSSVEKKLQQKQNDRKKMETDIVRWGSQIEKMKKSVESIISQKTQLESSMEKKLEDMREQLAQRQAANRAVEDENKELSNTIKELEKNKRKGSAGDGEDIPPAVDVSLDEDKLWEEKLRTLQNRYTMAWNTMLQAENMYAHSQQHLDRLQQRRISSPQLFAATPTLEPAPVRRGSTRRRRQESIRSEINSPASVGFTGIAPPPFNSSISGISPTFSSNSPFFNITNGMTIEPEESQTGAVAQAQIDAMTGGAPMSPATAGALLPSGLLADDTDHTGSDMDLEKAESPAPGTGRRRARPLSFGGDSGSFNNTSNRNSAALPGLGTIPGLGTASTFDSSGQAPSSPVSADSRSPSVFASPKESTTNLPFSAADPFGESDRRSVLSNTGSSRRASGGPSRFAGILGLGARGKFSMDQGPLLGSLKTTQTRSLPRQDPSEHEPAAFRRRGSHSGPSWIQPISNAFSRNTSGFGKDATDGAEEGSETSASRRFIRPFSMLGRSGDSFQPPAPFNHAAPPPPPSNNSSEFPRPSTGSEQRFGWRAEGLNQRTSPLGPDWGAAVANSYSRQTSRRPSVQYGPPNILGQDVSAMDMASFDPPRSSSQQPPIGTRPMTSQDKLVHSESAPPTPPRLNPAAPSFNLFKRSKKTEEGEKDKAPDRSRAKDISKDTPSPQHLAVDSGQATALDTSPPSESRKSRDAHSISTAAESVDLSSTGRDSLERTWSGTPSDSGHLAPSGTLAVGKDKETLMQKLSRKTSTSKFKKSFGKDNKGLFGGSRRGGPTSSSVDGTTHEETDEDGATPAGRSGDSAANSPLIGAAAAASGSDAAGPTKSSRASGRWGSLKLTRKKSRAPSVNESVTTSETGDEEDVLPPPDLAVVQG